MLEIKSVSKMYAAGIGLRSASFSAFPGDVIAIVGPNGSGKSTLLSVISDRYHADSGVCLLDNQLLNKQKERISILLEEPYLVESMNGIQYLKYIAGLKGMLSFETIDLLIDFFDVEGYIKQKISYMSQGQRKRIVLISALMNDPSVLILDEPTNGFDTQTILRLKKILAIRSERKQITLLASHVLDFVQSVATKVIFIKSGQTSEVYSIDMELETKYAQYFNINNL